MVLTTWLNHFIYLFLRNTPSYSLIQITIIAGLVHEKWIVMDGARSRGWLVACFVTRGTRPDDDFGALAGCPGGEEFIDYCLTWKNVPNKKLSKLCLNCQGWELWPLLSLTSWQSGSSRSWRWTTQPFPQPIIIGRFFQ